MAHIPRHEAKLTSPRPIYLHNTLGHALEVFESLTAGQVRMYTCGPTVYSYQHIGNMRAFIFSDTLRRVLEYNGYDVHQVRNITDVGHLTNDTLGTGADKIELAARKQNMTPEQITDHVTEIFHRDADLLNIQRPTVEPRATEYIPQMMALAERLIDRGHAYAVKGDVYFDVSTFPAYGKLSGNTVEELVAGARVEVSADKRSPADFALWKAAAPDRIMRWESPWGEGVPGWHLECSAMALDLLGETLDIHTGGEDHVFPHHEDEIAQSEGATGKPFARYWIHNAFLQLAGDEKMSKSVGNVLTIADLRERGIHPLSFRYFTFQAHYRTPLSVTWEALEASQTALYRVWEQLAELVQSEDGASTGDLDPHRAAFHEAINRDLDLPAAVASLHGLLGSKLSPCEKLELARDFDRVLGLDLVATAEQLSELRPGDRESIEQRSAARARKDWPESDRIRTQLSERGLDVKDTAAGPRWVRRDVLPRTGSNQA
jgi:cysteinyl-tRNA synthetase